MVNKDERISTMSIVIPSLRKFGLFKEGSTTRGSFEGFTGEERELNYRLQCRKILHMEEMMDKLLERI